MAGQTQVPVSLEDVMVFLSRAEWELLPVGQRELYRDVVLDTYELLTSLGYPGPKPNILQRLERGEEPWICPSPEHARAESWQEEPLSSWCPGAGGCPELEEGPDPPCPGRIQALPTPVPEGWSTPGSPRDQGPQKLGCVDGRSEFPSQAADGVGSQAQTWPVKKEAEDNPGDRENLTQSVTFSPHSIVEHEDIYSWDQLWEEPPERCERSTQLSGSGSGEQGQLGLEELREAVAKDHSYCLPSGARPSCCALGPCTLGEHNYSHERQEEPGSSHAQGHGAVPAAPDWLPGHRAHEGGVVCKAKDIVGRYRPYRRGALPCGCCPPCRAPEEGTHRGTCLPKDLDGPCALRSGGNSRQETLDTQQILGQEFSAPCPEPADGVRPAEAARTGRFRGRGARRGARGRPGPGGVGAVPLRSVFRAVVRAVRDMLSSVCERLELQGLSNGTSIWPIIIQIDNLSELGQL
ncbi:zinc finger protein 316-like [Pithys albifrons albifrons]|uniref:zinc finger protein 316-like n=1 Tax=Pithys albifrons albifrons TaxID=3385563 RepID=UPI003A5D0CEF